MPGFRFILFLLLIPATISFAQKTKPYNNLLKTDTILIPLSKSEAERLKKRLPVIVDSSTRRKPKPVAMPIPVYPTPEAALKGNVSLVIHINMEKETVTNMADLKLFITISNKSYRAQRFLFDRPVRASGGIWSAQCTIINAQEKSVLEFPYSSIPETKKYSSADLLKYEYDLAPGEWIMKAYSVSSLVTYNNQFLKNGKLLPGRYSLQLILYGNVSNAVSFTIR
ncbi:hypothetical protein ACTHGU_03150 [Chitinophagaceae bacterium MMS25-I14]